VVVEPSIENFLLQVCLHAHTTQMVCSSPIVASWTLRIALSILSVMVKSFRITLSNVTVRIIAIWTAAYSYHIADRGSRGAAQDEETLFHRGLHKSVLSQLLTNGRNEIHQSAPSPRTRSESHRIEEAWIPALARMAMRGASITENPLTSTAFRYSPKASECQPLGSKSTGPALTFLLIFYSEGESYEVRESR
jgi:hypothetical protein